MALSAAMTVTVINGDTVQSTVSTTGEGIANRDVAVGNGVTDKEVAIAFLAASLQFMLITTDKDLTLETNDGAAADDTFTLKAGVPFFWQKNSGITNPFTADVTKFFFTNAGGTSASVKIRCMFDATP